MPRTYGTNPPKYTDLSDVPASLSGDANKVVAVNTTASGLEHRVLTAADIPSLDASKITTGVFDANEIPSLSANKIATDTLSVDRIPNLSANKITSDLIGTARLATGTANNTTYLRGDQTWQTIVSNSTATIQTNAPTATTNATLGTQIYATSDNRKYLCIDATTNSNVWSYWNRDGTTNEISFTLDPTATFASGSNMSANTALENGALFWLGSSGKTVAYSNVHTSGKALITWSSGGSSVNTVDRTANDVGSGNVSGSFVRVDLGASRTLACNTIVWQHGYSAATYRLLNYSIQGSNDASTSPTNWVNIVTYSNAPPPDAGYSYKKDVFMNFTYFRHYRILMSGNDSSGSQYLQISDIELFGTARGAWT